MSQRGEVETQLIAHDKVNRSDCVCVCVCVSRSVVRSRLSSSHMTRRCMTYVGGDPQCSVLCLQTAVYASLTSGDTATHSYTHTHTYTHTVSTGQMA